MKRATTAAVIATLATLVPASAAAADTGSTTVTSYSRSGVETIACTGDTAWFVTEDNHEVIHQQSLADGSLQFVDNDTQTFTVQHADGSGPVYSGRGIIHLTGIFPASGGESAPLSYVFHVVGSAPDGSVFAMDEVRHAWVQPDGSISVSVDQLRCGV